MTAAASDACVHNTAIGWMLTFSVRQLSVSRSFCGLLLLSGMLSWATVEAWETEVRGTVFGAEWVVMFQPAHMAAQTISQAPSAS